MSRGLMSGRSQKLPGKYTSWKAETPPEMQNLESVNLTTEGGGELSFSRSQMQREQAQRVFGGLPAADLRKVQQKHTPWGAGLIWKSRGSVLCLLCWWRTWGCRTSDKSSPTEPGSDDRGSRATQNIPQKSHSSESVVSVKQRGPLLPSTNPDANSWAGKNQVIKKQVFMKGYGTASVSDFVRKNVGRSCKIVKRKKAIHRKTLS